MTLLMSMSMSISINNQTMNEFNELKNNRIIYLVHPIKQNQQNNPKMPNKIY